MSILISWLGPLRAICMAIDGVAFSLLDNAYMLVIKLSTAELFQHETIRSITNNVYILIGVVAFFRLAIVLVNAIIDPEKLNEKGKGLSNIFFRVVGMVILLAVTPFLFQLSYELQGKIVGGDADKNIIFKTILGDNANMGGQNAGKALQNIALSSLITVNENYYEDFDQLVCVSNGDGTCTNQGGYVYGKECDWDNCYSAVSLYNDLYVNEDMSPTKLAKWAGVSKKIDGEEVYVYDYMMIVTTVVGIFMTYIIISFAIDIAVRMFELLVLEVLSPLFIATFVDPKSSQSGPFKNWISAVGKSYASLYIKLAILALIILLISLVNQSKIFNEMGDLSGWTKIFVVIGLLIFAKKAPKWIMDIIGIKGDGMGLWTPKKLKENMLGSGAIMAGAATGAALVGNRLANHNNRKAQRKQRNKAMNAALDTENYANKKDLKRRGIVDDKGNRLYGKDAVSYFSKKHDIPKAPGIGQSMLQDVLGSGNAVVQGIKLGKGADSLTDALKIGGQVTSDFKKKNALGGEGIFTKAGRGIKRVTGGINDAAWGTAADRFDANKAKEKLEKQENYLTAEALKNHGLDVDNKVLGIGDISKMKVQPHDFGDLMAMAHAKAINADWSYDSAGRLHITDKNGTEINRDEAMQKGRAMYSDEGIANMQKDFNTFQQNSVSEASTNAQNINQLTSAIQSMASHLDKMEISGLANGMLNLADGSQITLDKKSIKSLTNAQADITRKINSETDDEKRKKMQQQNDDISNMLSFMNQLNTSYSELSTAQSRQIELNAITAGASLEYDVKDIMSEPKNLGFTTKEQIQNYLNVKSGDFDKEVAYAKEAREKKKGDTKKE